MSWWRQHGDTVSRCGELPRVQIEDGFRHFKGSRHCSDTVTGKQEISLGGDGPDYLRDDATVLKEDAVDVCPR
ncbi:uncharacterized protein Dvir_GJ26455 [Drosophila virilis]|uniref:Uncharacterized protein n=1 Tax=Drosophila virilis TaxID=7244 RepID=A0A0Q9WKR6_DROVI|nr:uncharacterized protein Dvir_GJ26455 [Drosophila virilis]